MSRAPQMSRQAAALKKSFDEAFAQPLQLKQESGFELLAVRLGGAPWAIPLSAITGLHCDKKITPLPGRTPGLLGIAGFRGVLLPVYDLAARIGLAAAAQPRWMVVASNRRIALAFAELEGHLRVDQADFITESQGGPPWTGGFVRVGGENRPVLHLPVILDNIPRRKDPLQEGNET